MTERINAIGCENLIKYYQRNIDLDFVEDEDSDQESKSCRMASSKCIGPPRVAIYTEFIRQSSLDDMLKNFKAFTEPVVKVYF